MIQENVKSKIKLYWSKEKQIDTKPYLKHKSEMRSNKHNGIQRCKEEREGRQKIETKK